MGRQGKELSPQTRTRICELNSAGWGYKRIHNRHPEIPISTIKFTIYNKQKRLNKFWGFRLAEQMYLIG